MEINFYNILKKLAQDYPNDMDFGSKVRRVLLELEGEVENEVLSVAAGKMEIDSDLEKLKPTEEEISKLEDFLNNIKTNEDGI
jgi:hypothetical protein